MSDLAMFYLDLLEEAGLGNIHLIGNSLGGWLAAEILVRDRARFSRLRPQCLHLVSRFVRREQE
jgi:pimeloyl-ACP methyl ester carboxylesterase